MESYLKTRTGSIVCNTSTKLFDLFDKLLSGSVPDVNINDQTSSFDKFDIDRFECKFYSNNIPVKTSQNFKYLVFVTSKSFNSIYYSDHHIRRCINEYEDVTKYICIDENLLELDNDGNFTDFYKISKLIKRIYTNEIRNEYKDTISDSYGWSFEIISVILTYFTLRRSGKHTHRYDKEYWKSVFEYHYYEDIKNFDRLWQEISTVSIKPEIFTLPYLYELAHKAL